MQQARGQMEQTSRTANTTSKAFDAITKSGTILGGTVVGAIGASVRQAANFESAMDKVKAITNATDSDFAKLTDTAKDLGAKTAYSSEQVSEAMYNLGASGYSTSQIIAAMPGILDLAAAAQTDLGTSSDIVASIMSGFGMSAEKTSYIVDVLAKAANSANMSIPDLGESFKYVGPIAKTLGISIEDTASAIGILSNAGIKGSESGTALRAAFIALNSPSKESAKLMKELGIHVTDAQGKMKPLPQLVGDIGEKLKGMTQSQKVATVSQLVGTEAASGFLSLIDAGPDKIENFSKSLKDSGGTAEKVAKIQMTNLNGQIEQFKGALSNVAVEVGEDFLPALTEVAKKAAEVVSKLDDADLANLKAGLSFGGTTAAILTTGGALGKMALAIRGLLTAMGPVGFAIAGLSLVGGAIAAIVTKNKEMEAARLNNIKAGFEETKSLDATIKAYDDLKMKSHLTNDEFGRYLDLQADLSKTSDPKAIAKIKDEMDKLQKKSGLSNDELSDMIGYNKTLVDKTPEVKKAISQQGQAYVDNTKKVKEYNQAQLDSLYDKLNIERIKTETQYKDLLSDEKDLIQEIKDKEGQLTSLTDKRNDAKKIEKAEEEKLNNMLANRQKYTDNEVQQQRIKVKLATDDVSLAQKRLEKQAESIQKSDTELDKTRESIKKLEDKRLEMAQIVLQQNGLNSKKGDELNTINKAISKLEEQKKKLQETTPVAQRNTGQYKDAVSAIDTQIGKLQSAKTKVEEITGAAKKMNAEFDKDVQKWVKVYVQQQTSASKNLDKYKFMEQKLRYHTGGLVGRQQMPMLHTGGLASQFASLPNHNEVDVRLLRNEMVLTEAQQANLMRMIDAGMTTGTKDGSPSIGRQFNNDVKVYANNAEFTEEDLVKSLQRLGALYSG